MNKKVARLVVYSRAGCHLCDELIADLRDLLGSVSFDLNIVDVDSDRDLAARYGKRVPVLVASGTELCHYHLDAGKVNEYLSKIR